MLIFHGVNDIVANHIISTLYSDVKKNRISLMIVLTSRLAQVSPSYPIDMMAINIFISFNVKERVNMNDAPTTKASSFSWRKTQI